MARLIVDGYNLLPAAALRDRDALIAALGLYARTRGHDVTVVFDGTHQGTGLGDRYHEAGVFVIFTPLTVTADDYIIDELLEGAIAASTIVVSTDRKIQRAALARSIQAMDSAHFAKKMLEAPTSPPPTSRIARDDEDDRRREKKGNPRKKSKKERARTRAFKKL